MTVSVEEASVRSDTTHPSALNEISEREAEIEWKVYKFERRITKILKHVTEVNLGNVVEELEKIVEERPITRYVNCSELKKLLDVIMQKAIENEDFLQYKPCLIKIVAGM